MTARYKLRTADDFDGAPVLIMTIQIERELVLTSANILALQNSVESRLDGHQELPKEEKGIWLDTLETVNYITNETDNRRQLGVSLSTEWSTLPDLYLDAILDDYVLKSDQQIRIYAEGRPDNPAIAFQLGQMVAKFSVSRDNVDAIQSDFKALLTVIEEGESAGLDSAAINYNIDQAINAGIIFTSAGLCAAGLAGAVETAGLSALVTASSCLTMIQSFKAALDRAKKEAEDRAERVGLERDFSRAMHGGDGRSMAGEPKGLGGGMMRA